MFSSSSILSVILKSQDLHLLIVNFSSDTKKSVQVKNGEKLVPSQIGHTGTLNLAILKNFVEDNEKEEVIKLTGFSI